MPKWNYEKMQEDGSVKICPTNDYDGSVCGGRIVMNVKAWFDENPEERKRLGWIKHIYKTQKEIEQEFHYNEQTQYLVKTPTQVDEYTVEDVYHVIDKSEEMLLFEEMLRVANGNGGGIWFTGGDWE